MHAKATIAPLHEQAEIGFLLARSIENTRDLLNVLNAIWQREPNSAIGDQVTATSDALHLLKEARP